MKFLGIVFALLLISCAHQNNAKDKKIAKLHLRLGMAYLVKNQHPRAIKELRTALSLDNKNPYIHNSLAIAYSLKNKNKMAEKHLLKALKLNPQFTEARNNLGKVLISMKRYDLAIRVLKKARKDLVYVYPDRIHYNLGFAYFKKRKFKTAGRYFKKSISINNSFCPAYQYYGRVFFEFKKYKKALSYFKKAQGNCSYKMLGETAYYKGLTYLKLGKKSNALVSLKSILKNQEDEFYVHKARNVISNMKRLVQ